MWNLFLDAIHSVRGLNVELNLFPGQRLDFDEHHFQIFTLIFRLSFCRFSAENRKLNFKNCVYNMKFYVRMAREIISYVKFQVFLEKFSIPVPSLGLSAGFASPPPLVQQ